MKIRSILTGFMIVGCLVLGSACTSGSTAPKQVTYLDESTSDSVKRELVQCINSFVQAVNKRDQESFNRVSEQGDGPYGYYTQDQKMYVLSVSEPQFDPETLSADSTSAGVTVHQRIQTVSGEEDRTSVYIFGKKEGSWRIYGVEL